MDKMLTVEAIEDLTIQNLELNFLLTQAGNTITVGRSEVNSK